MNKRSNTIWKKIVSFVDKYSILVAAIVIYGYYLITSIDLIKNNGGQKGFLDYLLQFDSLILLWVIGVVFIQLQKYRKQRKEEDSIDARSKPSSNDNGYIFRSSMRLQSCCRITQTIL